jgi:hypothetical protein
MSGLPPKADVCGANRQVCFGPEADIATIMSFQAAMQPRAVELV